MSKTRLDVFDRAVGKAEAWIGELAAELGWEEEFHRAYEALGAVLHVLRDRLPVQEAVDLGAQLPLLLRGLYYQNWDVSVNPEKYRHAEEFHRHVRGRLARQRPGSVSEERIVEAVAGLLGARLSEGELRSVRRALPPEVRQLFPGPGKPDPDLGRSSGGDWLSEERDWERFSE